MRTKTIVLPFLLAATPLLAQDKVESRRPADREAAVSIEVPSGTVHVVGWDKDEVLVTGSVSGSATGVDLSGSPARIQVEVETEGSPARGIADLEVKVPVGARVSVESFGAAVSVTGVSGRLRVESVHGSITADGGMQELDLETVNGSIEARAPARRVHAETTNGALRLQGVSGEVEVSNVTGRVEVSGGPFTRLRIENVSGSVRVDASLARDAELDAETVSGSVELALPADVGARLQVSTFSGHIDSDFALPAPTKTGDYGPERELNATLGGGGAKISVHTLSGRVSVRKRTDH
jgi:DUF4097 and DUF4098 domain-containing protein YvlB